MTIPLMPSGLSQRPPAPTSMQTAFMSPKPLSESEMMRSQLPLVCVYVITYNGKKFLDRCFQTLQQLTDYANHRLILVDNGSSDGSGEYVRENFPQADVLRIFPNAGYAHGANAAIEDARRRGAKYIVVMNDDIEILHSHWLHEAVCARRTRSEHRHHRFRRGNVRRRILPRARVDR